MTKQEILQAIACLISDLFGVDADEISIETTRESIDGWDSLQHVNLIIDLESQFDIHLSEVQIARIQSVRDIVDIVVEEKAASK